MCRHDQPDPRTSTALTRLKSSIRPQMESLCPASRPGMYVGSDKFIYYVEGDPTQRLAPNIYVAVDTAFTDADHP